MTFRLLDLFLAFIGLVLLSGVLVIVFLILLRNTRAPLFKQVRIGKNKNEFVLYKFRTMKVGTSSLPTHLVDSSAITTVGKLLRKTKIDELPQLVNVLKGDMSLVGPRPGLATQTELTCYRDFYGVFDVRPGITGLSQTLGIDMSTPELLAQTDSRMIAELSIVNYFRYIALTILGKGRGDQVQTSLDI